MCKLVLYKETNPNFNVLLLNQNSNQTLWTIHKLHIHSPSVSIHWPLVLPVALSTKQSSHGPLSPQWIPSNWHPCRIHVYNWPPYLWSQATLLAKFQSSRIRKCILQMTVWLSWRTYIFIIWTMDINFNFLSVLDWHSEGVKDSVSVRTGT